MHQLNQFAIDHSEGLIRLRGRGVDIGPSLPVDEEISEEKLQLLRNLIPKLSFPSLPRATKRQSSLFRDIPGVTCS